MWSIHKVAVSLVDCLLRECEDKKEYREIYEYSLETILSLSINLAIIMSWAAVFGVLENVACFLLFFFPYRFLFGGAHAKTNIRCILVSNVCLLTSVLVSRVMPVFWGMLAVELIIMCISMSVNFYYMRVCSSGKKIVCLMYPVVMLVLINMVFHSYVNGVCATLGLLIQAISFYIKNRG